MEPNQRPERNVAIAFRTGNQVCFIKSLHHNFGNESDVLGDCGARDTRILSPDFESDGQKAPLTPEVSKAVVNCGRPLAFLCSYVHGEQGGQSYHR
ncbi:LOW QUALITY PROTEIN: hypothetical protein BC938DRAFT_478780 [Jimgerdemannia flammicorona]|uniref:Uncharacterized protein n=1 Tax=Jimgerdemannia flammicorona TaxID=994334 RepID=A0A433QMA9_9FUNG|nr:LOW QUALITY PROTEIN: hypothetical protein BC938DRAFT_478780 [Jimgerdemannia flammicorona]